MDNKITKQIDSYYNSWFEINNVYALWSKIHGIEDSTLFVLHEIYYSKTSLTQSEICKKLLYPKQTISQILASLEKNDYITKEQNENDRRNKLIKLTDNGKRFASPILKELKSAECEAFLQLSEKQRENLIESFKLLTEVLSKNLAKEVKWK